MRRQIMAASLALLASGCSKPAKLSVFAGTQPVFDPVSFWTGHTHSWGVVETPGGAPSETVQTDCTGTPDRQGGLHMVQTLTEGDGTIRHRDWHLKRVSPGHYEATANDMDGVAQGEAAGRVFHWRWIWKTAPGNPLRNVVMSQWMYAMPDGTLMNRTTITKLGMTVAQVSEIFTKAQ